MKRATFLVALTLGATALPMLAQQPEGNPVPLPAPQDVVTGEAFFLERIALAPDAKLFVSLVGRVAGEDNLPLASTIVPARSGSTPFQLLVPQGLAPIGPYRVRAWIVSGGRVFMVGREPLTTLTSLKDEAKIRLQIRPAPVLEPRDNQGEGDATAAQGEASAAGGFVNGTIVKRDRRALSPDAQIEVTLSDVSLADAQIEVTLSDVSLADAPAKVMGKQTFSSDGKQLPIAFAVPVATTLEPKRRYSLMVRITEGGKLTYISDTLVPVTPENVTTAFEINVVRVGGA